MSQHTLLLWVGVSAVVVVAVVLFRWVFKKRFGIELSELLGLALAVLGTFSSFQLFYKALTFDAWQSCLGSDITALVFGAFALFWVSVKEIFKILNEE